MSLTVHPFDGPNLPARLGTLFRVPRIQTHRQLICAQIAWETYYHTQQLCIHERSRQRGLFRTANEFGEDCEPVVNLCKAIENARPRKRRK